MSGIGKNLYPPIVPTYQTPFVHTNSCRVYFSLPSYNKAEDFSREVQVTISTQNDNRSVLNKSKYPIGIMCLDYQIDNKVKGDNKYFITLFNSDIENGFIPEIYYKIQIRLSKVRYRSIGTSSTPSSTIGIAATQNWINQNLDNFSEWSTISLAKCIYEPRFELKPFSLEDMNRNIVFSTGFQTLSGTMYFWSSGRSWISSEYLKSYRIYITKKDEGEDVLYVDSGEQYPINKNEVFYNIEKKLENGSKYSITIELYTNNGYTLRQDGYNFTVFKTIDTETDANITVEPDYINGRAKVKVWLDNTSIVNNFAIKRSSSKSDFLIWEDVHYCSLYDEADLEYEWYDYTLESGVLYQYAIQRIDVFNNIRNREKIAVDENNNSTIIMLPLEDIFLSRAGMQFKVKFDPAISSFKTNYLETKSETLGSKYPFIRRNGKVKYREFPIAGLITHFCDEEGLFLNKDNLYTEDERIYYDGQGVGYNITNGITEYKDFVYEKYFRDKIINFLQEDSTKLFRSPTEGNMLVKLMNINFTPNQSLGRMLYSFSATAVEIADCTIDNYDKYGIQFLEKENLRKETEKHSYKIGQLNEITGTGFVWETNIVDYLKDKYSKILSKKARNENQRDIEISVKGLKWIKLTFNSKPILINKNGEPDVIFQNEVIDINLNKNMTYLGYLIKVNGERVIVNKNGIYELKGDNVNITSLSVPTGSQFTLDYIVELVETEPNVNKPTFTKKVLYNNIGQIHDKFKVNEYFIEKIRSKYIIQHPKFSQNFALLNDITIEADSGTILNIIQKIDNNETFTTKHEIGKTNILKLKDIYQDNIFLNFCFQGRHLYKKEYNKENDLFLKVSSDKGEIKTIPYKEYSNSFPYILKIMDKFGNDVYIAEDEYLDLSDLTVKLNNVKTKLNNCLFTESGMGNYKIYYKNKWYNFNYRTGIVPCPVDALIDYTYSLIREEY